MDPQPADAPAGRLDVDAVEAELAAVEEALRRLDDGTYERCERCGGPIDDDVLAAAPAIRRCAACAPPARPGA